MITNNPHKKLTRFEGLSFASGDLFGGGAQTMIAFFYLRFLTDMVGIQPGLAALVIAVSKIWDAVSDPLMGVITDNTRSRWGRRRPYFLVGFFAIIIAMLLLWLPVRFENTGLRAAFVLFSYLFYSTVQTIVMVPYSAMSAEISMDYEERNFVNGTRLLFSQLSTLLAAVLPMVIIAAFADTRLGYNVMALVFGVFYATPFLLIFFFCNERVPEPDEKAAFDLRIFLKPMKLRSFRLLVAIYLGAFLIMDITSSVFTYYMDYFLRRPGELEYVLGTLLVVSTCLVPLVIYMANRMSKARSFLIFLVVWLLGIVLISQINTGWPSWAIYVIAAIMGIGTTGGIVTPWIMYPDVTDVGELAFGKRVSGSFSGLMTFFRKVSGALAIFIVGLILQVSGYRIPLQEVVEGKLVVTKFDQPESVIIALRLIVAVIPLILLGIVFYAAWRYPLTKELHERLVDVLKFRRGEQPGKPVSQADEAAIRQALI